uniref:pyruvate dehydrogenase protein X component, mitochondrial-like isoform X2 n=1 Tax=Myxine glutinosa TaxID=7769 RepID=UPI00358DEF38
MEQGASAGPRSRGRHSGLQGSLSMSRKLSPAARLLLASHGLQAEALQPSGRFGVVTKEDVLKAIALKTGGSLPSQPLATSQPTAPPSGPSVPESLRHTQPSLPCKKPVIAPVYPRKAGKVTYTDEEISDEKRSIACRLGQSKNSIPHAYVSALCQVDSVLSLATQLGKDGVQVSIGDFIIKAAALSLKTVGFVESGVVDVAVTMATPDGIVSPVIRRAGSRGLLDIATVTKELADRARHGKIPPKECEGGNFCVSLLDSLAVSYCTSIVSVPHPLVLSVGSTSSRVRPAESGEGGGINDDGENKSGMVRCKFVNVTLSCDATRMDAEQAGQFLKNFRYNLEQPIRLLL